MISTHNLSPLPDVDRLRHIMQSMAMLDTILCPEWEYRYYSFNAGWATGEQMGSMRDGSGNGLFALFNAAGCWLKGSVLGVPMSPYRKGCAGEVWAGILDSVPSEFANCLREPAFDIENTSFCIWRRHGEPSWRKGQIEYPPDHPDPDGSEKLLSALDGDPQTYRDWAEDYYERAVCLTGVTHIYEHRPLTSGLVAQLNPDISLADLQLDLAEIGYQDEGRVP
jgi:hypothetical protein